MVTIVLKSPMIYVELRFVIFVLLAKKKTRSLVNAQRTLLVSTLDLNYRSCGILN